MPAVNLIGIGPLQDLSLQEFGFCSAALIVPTLEVNSSRVLTNRKVVAIDLVSSAA